MSLLESPTGHLSNLSAPGLRDFSEGRREQELALFMPASNEEREGFARLLNHSEESGTVRIYGIDDEGEWSGPVTLSLEAGAAAHFNSGDLEGGNAEKGLSGALGVGSGSWRLRLYTELDLESLAYVRTGDGFVTTMHERVRESAMRHHVAFFNPGSNRSQVSRLRLINPTEEDVEVTIAGRDDDGEAAPGGEVSLTLGPGEARMLSAQELEEGGAGLAGSLGDGSSKWQLFVSADASIEVMNLLRSPTGHLANLSASSQEGVVNEGGIDEPVALNVIVDLPPEVSSVQASDLVTTVLGAGGDGVPPGGAPALLVASDADGAVLYALVDEDGGLLGEAQGTVRVSVASTAVVVMALAVGYRIPSVTPEAVEAILSHAEFGALTRQLTRLMGEDKNSLVRLSDYPDVVAVMQRMARSLSGAASPARAKASAAVARAAAPGGNVKTDFYCIRLTRWPCSPWDAHEPWRWFGNARGAEAYKPDGTRWTNFLRIIIPGGVYVEAYHDFLEEAKYPPFLARSDAEGSRELHAAANPSFVGYAMELYEGSQYRYPYYVPGNTTVLDKILNSGAAYREVLAGDGLRLSPDIDRIRFQRYRLTGRVDGEGLPDHAAVVSFLNTMHFAASVANVVTDVSVVEKWLDGLRRDPRLYGRIVECAGAYTERFLETNDPNQLATEQMLAFFRDNAGALFGTLLSNGGCRELILEAGLEKVLEELIARASLEAVVDMLTGVKPLFDVANDTVPGAVSYFAPGAARSEYYVDWEETPGGQAYIAQVSERPLPVAEFTYAQQQGFRVELDGSRSEGDGLSYEWMVGRERIGTGRTLVHDFGEEGAFEVTLEVTDRSGVTAEEHGRVRVTAGRVPEVESLTCTPTGSGKAFSMQAEFTDGDDDIESVQWYSSISNARPDRETGAGTGSVTLSAPDDATYTRAKVRVVDARGNTAERNCPVEFDAAPPTPGIGAVSAEEGEALEFTVTLDRVADETVTYYYATYRSTARTDDYDGHLATELRFASGERSKTITVLTTEDTRVERDETFYVYITESTGDLPYSGLPSRYLARAAGTILDDDETGEAAPVPRIADVSAEEGEALEFTVTLGRTPSDAVTFYYATYRGTAGRDDYAGHFATALRFGSGEHSKTITVRTTEDTEVEDDETFYVYVTESTSDLTASAPTRYRARATGTIRDDDGDFTDLCTGSNVHIPDATLRAAVEDALGKGRGARITPADMRRLRSLPVSDVRGIESLTGLQCATGLTELNLGLSRISDVSPLSGLTALKTLRLHGNQITDVSPLAGLTGLMTLFLSDNQITDVSPLSGLTALRSLLLAGNQITDVSPLAGLTALELLWLPFNQVADVSPLSGLRALERLLLHGNQITDVSPLSGLTALESLWLPHNQITDVSPLAGLTALEWLLLNHNQITDVSPLSGLIALEELHLQHNQITDVSLAGLTALKKLLLYNNQITDVSLSELTALESLYLSHNRITDVSTLSGLTALERLFLDNNQITDIGPLVANSGLGDGDLVWLYSNPLSIRSREVHIPALRARGVSVEL